MNSADRATCCFDICFGPSTKKTLWKKQKRKNKTEKKSDFMSNFMQPESCGLCVCRSQGAAVLRMLSEFLTEPVFARGLSVRINPVININSITVWVAVCLGAGGVDVLWMLQIKPFIYFLLLTTDLVWCFLLLTKPPSFPMWKTNLFFTSPPPSPIWTHMPLATRSTQTCGIISSRSVEIENHFFFTTHWSRGVFCFIL